MRHTLVLRTAPALRVDARGLLPGLLCAMTTQEVLRLPLPHGREAVPVAEWFDVRSGAADDAVPTLVLEGDLSRFDCIGAELAQGRMAVHGSVGDCAGLAMTGGELRIAGSARDLAGCAMAGGWLEVQGDVADFAAGTLPGEADGMKGGALVVHGSAGARLADRMRRGTVVVHGDAGDWLASRMVAGTVALGGRCGAQPGWAMRRGSLVFAGEAPRPGTTFVRVRSDVQVAWQLLARDLAGFGGPFASLPKGRPQRWVGDLAVEGQGEWFTSP